MAYRIIAIDHDKVGGNYLKEWDSATDNWITFLPSAEVAGLDLSSCYALWASDTEIIAFAGAGAAGTFGHFHSGAWDTIIGTAEAGESVNAVSGTGNSNVWFQGTKRVWHWNGTTMESWLKTSIGLPSRFWCGIYSAAPDDVWVTNEFTLLHYDGVSWSSNLWSTLPASIITLGEWLGGIGGASGSDIYLGPLVVGGAGNRPVVHYNGSVWTDSGTVGGDVRDFAFMAGDEVIANCGWNYSSVVARYSGPSMGAWPIDGSTGPVLSPHGMAKADKDLYCAWGDTPNGACYHRDALGAWSALSNSNLAWSAIAALGAPSGKTGDEHLYYRDLLKDMLPPGAYNLGDDTVIHAICAGAGELLEIVEDDIEQLQKEVVPQTAEESLDQWEGQLDSPYKGESSIADRQAALTAIWRMAVGVKMHGLRSVLGPLLNMEYGFRDTCDDNDVNFQYEEVAGGGSSSETTDLVLDVAGAADAEWAGNKANQYMLLLRNHDRGDQITVEGVFNAATLPLDCHAGLIIYDSDDRAFTFGPVNSFGTVYLRLREKGPSSWPVHYSVAWPGYPAEIGIRFKNGIVSCGTVNPWSELDTVEDVVLTPKKIGVYIANDGSTAADLTIDEVRVQYGLSHNNVRLIEMPLDMVPSGGKHKFHGFVFRDPSDSGTYDINQAQRVLDKAKSGHTLWRIGESNSFKCDDPYSLTDRDVLNR